MYRSGIDWCGGVKKSIQIYLAVPYLVRFVGTGGCCSCLPSLLPQYSSIPAWWHYWRAHFRRGWHRLGCSSNLSSVRRQRNRGEEQGGHILWSLTWFPQRTHKEHQSESYVENKRTLKKTTHSTQLFHVLYLSLNENDWNIKIQLPSRLDDLSCVTGNCNHCSLDAVMFTGYFKHSLSDLITVLWHLAIFTQQI